jgi:thioredoxin-dependent peroxiredoxin
LVSDVFYPTVWGVTKVNPPITLNPGDPAPEFEAFTNLGNKVCLAEFKGHPVILYFYPKDDTPGCTNEACAFRDHFRKFEQRGAVVLGVSTDSISSHQKFAFKFKLPFALVADPDKKIVQAYGVWGQKSFMGRKYVGVHRVTFLIHPNGRIRKIWTKIKPKDHAQEVLAELDSLDSIVV